MHKVTVSRQGPLWFFATDEAGSGQADTLTGLVTAVNLRLANTFGASTGTEWVFEDGFVQEAMAVQEERARLKRLEDALDTTTRKQVVTLTDRGLSARDVSTLLGISAARVTQLRGSGFVHGDPDDSTKRAWVVSLLTTNGPVTKYVRGDLPDELEYDGQTYRSTGGGHSVNGDDVKYTYVPVST